MGAFCYFTVTGISSSVLILKKYKSENKPVQLRFIFIFKSSVFENGAQRLGTRHSLGRFSAVYLI